MIQAVFNLGKWATGQPGRFFLHGGRNNLQSTTTVLNTIITLLAPMRGACPAFPGRAPKGRDQSDEKNFNPPDAHNPAGNDVAGACFHGGNTALDEQPESMLWQVPNWISDGVDSGVDYGLGRGQRRGRGR